MLLSSPAARKAFQSSNEMISRNSLQFGATDCASCHGLRKWKPAELFDHARSKFPLTLGHTRVECVKCHPVGAAPAGAAAGDSPSVRYRGLSTTCAGCHKQPPDKVKLSDDCASCHAQDDVHLGQYGRQCQRCHGTTTFKGARLQ